LKKVAFIHYSSPPLIGGVEFVLQAQTEILLKHGYRVKVIVGKGEPFHPDIEFTLIPEIYSLHPENVAVREALIKGERAPLIPFKERLEGKVKEAIEDSQAIIIHNCLTMPFNPALTWALHSLAEREEKKFIAWVHDSPFFDPSYKPFLDSINTEEHPWNLLKKYSPCFVYVVISSLRRKQLAELLKISPQRIRVIPNGVDIGRFLGLSEEALEIYEKFKLYQADLIGLFPARLIKRKNLEMAIEIFSHLNRKGKKSLLIVTGPFDPHRAGEEYFLQLKELARKNKVEKEIIFLCELPTPDGKPFHVGMHLLRDLYLLSDFLILTSYQEGFGIPLLEAGLVKIPIFSTDIQPLPEVGGKEVFYFHLKDPPEKVAEMIIEVTERDLRIKMFKKILRNYTWDLIFQNHLHPLLSD